MSLLPLQKFSSGTLIVILFNFMLNRIDVCRLEYHVMGLKSGNLSVENLHVFVGYVVSTSCTNEKSVDS